MVNLTGRSVNCHHNAKNRREIIESRVNSVHVIHDAIRGCRQAPMVWVQAGGEGIYGDEGEGCCDEITAPGKGFLVETCKRWEQAFIEATTPGTRQVLLRIGFVLGAQGGALKTLGTLTRWGLGGSAGSGRQFINWIHETDLSRIIRAAIEQEAMTGVFNASGPNPVTNREFMRELRRVLRRPWSPPAPAWAVQLGARLLGSSHRLYRMAGPRLLVGAVSRGDCSKRGLRLSFRNWPGRLRPSMERRRDYDQHPYSRAGSDLGQTKSSRSRTERARGGPRTAAIGSRRAAVHCRLESGFDDSLRGGPGPTANCNPIRTGPV